MSYTNSRPSTFLAPRTFSIANTRVSFQRRKKPELGQRCAGRKLQRRLAPLADIIRRVPRVQRLHFAKSWRGSPGIDPMFLIPGHMVLLLPIPALMVEAESESHGPHAQCRGFDLRGACFADI